VETEASPIRSRLPKPIAARKRARVLQMLDLFGNIGKHLPTSTQLANPQLF